MAVSIRLCNVEHSLESGDGRREQDIIVRISKDSGILTLYCAAVPTALEQIKEVKTVETVCKSSQDFSLTHTVSNGEAGGQLIVPANIGELMDIHEDDDSEKDEADLLHHLMEESGKLAEIKGFRLVHRTRKYIRSIS